MSSIESALHLNKILIKLRIIAKNEQSIRRFYGLQSSQRPSNSMWVKSKFYILRPTKLSTAQATLLIFIMLAFALAIVILEKTFRNCNAGRRTEANGYIIYPWPWKFSSSKIFEKIKASLITYTWRLPIVARLRILIFLILTILRPNSTCQIGRNSCSCLKNMLEKGSLLAFSSFLIRLSLYGI